MKFREFIDAGFYINLDYKTGRRQKIEEMLQQYGLADLFTRQPAFAAFDHDVVCGYGSQEWIDCVTACAKSHAAAILAAKNRGCSRVLILEDDAAVYEDGITPAFAKLDAAVNALSQSQIQDWDALLLGCHLLDESIELVDRGLIRAYSFNGAHAYILNAQAFDKMLARCPPHRIMPYDTALIELPLVFSTQQCVFVQKSDDTSSIGGHEVYNPAGLINSYNKPISNLWKFV